MAYFRFRYGTRSTTASAVFLLLFIVVLINSLDSSSLCYDKLFLKRFARGQNRATIVLNFTNLVYRISKYRSQTVLYISNTMNSIQFGSLPLERRRQTRNPREVVAEVKVTIYATSGTSTMAYQDVPPDIGFQLAEELSSFESELQIQQRSPCSNDPSSFG